LPVVIARRVVPSRGASPRRHPRRPIDGIMALQRREVLEANLATSRSTAADASAEWRGGSLIDPSRARDRLRQTGTTGPGHGAPTRPGAAAYRPGSDPRGDS
jgi:hypothetical protein